MALSATTGTGTQSATGSPQTASSAGFNGQSSSAVQPGTATSALTTSQGGIPLGGANVSTVDLNATTTAQTAAVTKPATHHPSPALFGFSILFLLVAAGLFWATAKSVNKTTY